MTQPITARHDLTIWRNDDYYEYPIRVVGLDLTGIALVMEIRLGGDVTGVPLISLPGIVPGVSGAVNETQGVQFRGVTVVDGVEVSELRLRIDRGELQDLPYSGERGDAAEFEYALVIGGRTRMTGRVILPAHTYRSDLAPANRPASYGSSYARQAGYPDAGATLTVALDGGANVLVDGADLVSASILRAEAAAAEAANYAVETGEAVNNLGEDAFNYVGRPGDVVLVNGTPKGVGAVFWHDAVDQNGALASVDVFDRAAGTVNVAVYRGPLNALVRQGLSSFVTTGTGTSRRIALAAPLAVRAGDILAIQPADGALTVAEVQSGDVGYTYGSPFLPDNVSLGSPTTNGQVQVRFVITYRDQVVTAETFQALSEVKIFGARAVALSSGARPRVEIDAKLYGVQPGKIEISWRGYTVAVKSLPFTVPDQSAVKDFAVSGNSIDDATDTPKWHTILAARLGVISRFTARYSSDGRQTFRAGLDDLVFTFADDTVPAGGTAKGIAAINGNTTIDPNAGYAFLNTGDANLTTGVSLAGVLIDPRTGESRHGVASIPNAASAAYSFTQDAGQSAITLTGPAQFVPDIAAAFASADNFSGIGNNLFYSGVPGAYGDFTNASLYPVIDKFAAAAQGQRFMTRDVLPAGEWPADGSPNVIDGTDYKTHMFAAMEAWNARNEQRHPGSRPRSLPTSGFPNGRTLLKYMQDHGNGSSADNTAIAQGKIPVSLWTDGPHPNAAGHAIIADFYQEALQTQVLAPALPEGTTVTITASVTNPRTGEVVRTIAYATVEAGELATLQDAVDGVVTNSAYRPTPEGGSDLPDQAYYTSVDPADGLQYRYQRTAGGAGYTRGRLVYSKADVGLPEADNTSDSDKPVSDAQAAAIDDARSDAAAMAKARATMVTPFAGLATITVPSDTSAIRIADRGQMTLGEVPAPYGVLPASGQGKWWTLDAAGRRFWIVSDLTSEALGAVRDGVANDLPVLKELIEVAAPFLGRTARISRGTHAIIRATAADVIYLPSNSRLIFDPGAKLKGAINLGGYYLPFLAAVERLNVSVIGASEKCFVFTNRLTFGPGQDFLAADPSFTPNVANDRRLGSSADYLAYVYASGICFLGTSNVLVKGIGCESFNAAATTRGAAYAHSLVQFAGNCNYVGTVDIDVDDAASGILAQGGTGTSLFMQTRMGRSSQDVSIPNHALYVFTQGRVIIDKVQDDGIEWGYNVATIQGSHTVSYGGAGPVVISGITSAKSGGILNIKGCIYGAVVDGLSYRMGDITDPSSGAIVPPVAPEQGRLYFPGGSTNIQIRNAILNIRSKDVVSIGGNAGPGSRIEAEVQRDDGAACFQPWTALAGDDGTFDLVFRQVNTSGFQPPVAIGNNGNHLRCTYLLTLKGWAINAPTVQLIGPTGGYTQDCVFVLANRMDAATHQLNPPFGSPYKIWLGSDGIAAAPDSQIKQNTMIYADGLISWKVPAVAAGANLTARFPMQPALYDAAVTCDSAATTFTRNEFFILGSTRPKGTGSYQSTVISQGSSGTNSTAYTLTVTPSGNGYLDISATVTGSVVQAATTDVYLSLRRRGY
jgi:hypothetical protein